MTTTDTPSTDPAAANVHRSGSGRRAARSGRAAAPRPRGLGALAALRRFAWGSVVLAVVNTTALATAPPEAVGSLYLKGSRQYLCTASAVAGPELGLAPSLVILTAAHCIEPSLIHEPDSRRWVSRREYQVSFDEVEFFDVAPFRVGFSASGFDLAILLFQAAVPEVAPLRMGSWGGVDYGTAIHNYANPLGLGVQYFTGSVTMLRIEPSPRVHQREWFLNAVASLQVGPGSSGSLILNEDLEYVGVLSGVVESRFGSPFTVFVPLWKLPDFLSADEAGRDVTCHGCTTASEGVREDYPTSGPGFIAR